MKIRYETRLLAFRVVISLVLLACLLYALRHQGPSECFSNGRMILPLSVLVGAAFLYSLGGLLSRPNDEAANQKQTAQGGSNRIRQSKRKTDI